MAQSQTTDVLSKIGELAESLEVSDQKVIELAADYIEQIDSL